MTSSQQYKLILRVTKSEFVGQQWGGHSGEKIVSKDFTSLQEAENYYNKLREEDDWTSYVTISIIHQPK